MDTEMFYEARFMSEYKKSIDEKDYDDFSSIKPSRKPIIARLYGNIENRIKDTNIFYNSIVNLYRLNMDYRNAKTSYTIQHQALASSIISIIIALIAIFITIISNDNAIEQVVTCLNWLKDLLK